jgi:SAM-dependent MidA family methyltransferase
MPSWLAELVQGEGGKIRFDRFMELALYHPVYGYYSAQTQTIGSLGDFSTWVTLDDSLGRALTHWIRAESKALKLRHLTVIELGPGTGQLARTILRGFRPWEKLRYYIVDVNRPSMDGLARTFRRIKRFDSIEDALRATDGIAIVFSNEFVDAFPCRRFIRTNSDWDEIWIELRDGRWLERTLPTQLCPESTALSPSVAVGQFVEVHETYHSWLKEVSFYLRTGALLTIDYGGPAAEIYWGKRKGSLRAFFQHQRFEGMEIYRRPGKQDLTADVNFEDLRCWSGPLGFDEVAYTTQREFVQRWYPQAFELENPATSFVLDPAGAGTAFKVLHQRKLSENSARR